MAYHATRGPVPGRTTGRHFVFCTGIENSYPVITDKSGKSLRRDGSLDLCFGTDVAATQYEYLMDNGMTRDEYRFFLGRGRALRPYCIMGNDYYITNEHEVVEPGDEVHPSGEIFGYYVITHQYFERYRLPVMHTETNRKNDEEAPAWLLKQWVNGGRRRRASRRGQRAEVNVRSDEAGQRGRWARAAGTGKTGVAAFSFLVAG